jgi:ABC-type uncharacterized transport system fused permease/ATPase subunit
MIWSWLLAFEIIGESVLTSLIPLVQKYFFNALAGFQANLMSWLFVLFLVNFGYSFCQSIKAWIQINFSNVLRIQRTLQLFKGPLNYIIDNAPQRIQEDVKLAYNGLTTVYTEYAISSFIVVWLVIENWRHVDMVCGALGYAALSMGIALLFKKKMIYAETIVQSSEADFRKSLAYDFTRSLVRGFSLAGLYDCIRATKTSAGIRLNYNLFTKIQGSLVLVLPYLVLIPQYLKHTLALGDMMQLASVFSLIVVNTDILISVFPLLTQAKASVKRIEQLELHK